MERLCASLFRRRLAIAVVAIIVTPDLSGWLRWRSAPRQGQAPRHRTPARPGRPYQIGDSEALPGQLVVDGRAQTPPQVGAPRLGFRQLAPLDRARRHHRRTPPGRSRPTLARCFPRSCASFGSNRCFDIPVRPEYRTAPGLPRLFAAALRPAEREPLPTRLNAPALAGSPDRPFGPKVWL